MIDTELPTSRGWELTTIGPEEPPSQPQLNQLSGSFCCDGLRERCCFESREGRFEQQPVSDTEVVFSLQQQFPDVFKSGEQQQSAGSSRVVLICGLSPMAVCVTGLDLIGESLFGNPRGSRC